MMYRRTIALLACSVLTAGCSTGLSSLPTSDSAPGSAPEPKSVPTVLILDGSGSMTEADAPGPRIDAARAAAHLLVDTLPDDSTIALETYGTATGSAPADKPVGCQDVVVTVPLGPLRRDAMDAAIDAITPSGYTPISLALRTAADQLPEDDTAQAIVLVSDGEETCDVPPCDTATALKQSRPGLTISTVGFKLDGPAAEQLRCVADATGGIFIQAANADQLASRLFATQNLDQANMSLSAVGIHGVDIGTSIADIRAAHQDFPEAAGTGVVEVVWRDCDFGFVDGILDSIRPHDGGRTIDGVAPGDPVSEALGLYGNPLAGSGDGPSRTFTFDADPGGDTAYRIDVQDYAEDGGTPSGSITKIVLCRCKPPPAPAGPEEIILKPVDAQGNTMPGYLKDESMRDRSVDCSYGEPSPYDVTSGVRVCGSSADSGDACWPTSGARYVLCLIEPFESVLVLRAADGADTPLDPPMGPPQPMALELQDGTQCRARVGGSWPAQALRADYVGHFHCRGGSEQADFKAVWGPQDAGIHKGPDGWTVEVGSSDGPLTTLEVTKAYYVGVA